VSLSDSRPTIFTKKNSEGLTLRYLFLLKGAEVDIHTNDEHPPELKALGAMSADAVYISRGLALWGPALHSYIDERYPSPSLLPADLTMRAHTRLLAQEILRVAIDADNDGKDDVTGQTIAQLETAYDVEQFWLIPKQMTVVDAALVPLLFMAAARKTWDPKRSKFARYYKVLTESPAFRQAVAASCSSARWASCERRSASAPAWHLV
jgi:glutathione S-transferase